MDQLSLKEWLTRGPDAILWLKRTEPASYREFADTLQQDIFNAIHFIEQSADKRLKDGEDRITLDICGMLEQHGTYSVAHDKHSGGHVDLTVTHAGKKFSWIGEAKIFTSVSAIYEGFLQLTTRYKSPPPEDRGGLLAYIRKPDAKKQMDSWKERLTQEKLEDLLFQDCSIRPGLNFLSQHKHKSTGLPFYVWHACLLLHHEPEDKSARATQARKESG